MSRCTGHCCKRFHTRYSPNEWKRIAVAIKDQTDWERDNGDKFSHEFDRPEEVSYIADMLILVEGDPNGVAEMSDKLNVNHFYTCKHFDGKNCTAYDKRPTMCKDYPYGKPCSFVGCTLEVCKEAEVPTDKD